MIVDRDPGDENDIPRASDGLEAKAAAMIALIGSVGTVSQADLERVVREQRAAHLRNLHIHQLQHHQNMRHEQPLQGLRRAA